MEDASHLSLDVLAVRETYLPSGRLLCGRLEKPVCSLDFSSLDCGIVQYNPANKKFRGKIETATQRGREFLLVHS